MNTEPLSAVKLKEKSGVVDAPIGRSTADRKKMCVTDKEFQKRSYPL